MLTKSLSRFTTFPIMYPDLWNLYKKAISSFWTVEEIDFSADMNNWESLKADEQNFIKMVLSFFAASDGIIMENINLNFGSEIQISEARSFYSYQAFNESIHSEAYSLMIDKFIRDPVEKNTLLNSIENVKAVKQKASWAMKWLNSDIPFVKRLVAFACVEGVFFSGSFCSIFWLKKRGLMPGLSFSNELISRDEGLHQEFAVTLYSHMVNKLSDSEIYEIVSEAVEIEKAFITEALPCKLVGMDCKEMSMYIEFVADRLMNQMGVQKLFNTENPFDWMENISLEGKTNFFEKRVGDYSKHIISEGDSVRFNEDF